MYDSLSFLLILLFVYYLFCLNANIEKTEIIIEIMLISLSLHPINKGLINQWVSIACIECYAWTQERLHIVGKLRICHLLLHVIYCVAKTLQLPSFSPRSTYFF